MTRMQRLRRLAIDNFRGRGRLSRKGLMVSIGLLYLVGAATAPLQLAMIARTGRSDFGLPDVLLSAIGLGMGWFLLGALIRRLHDRGRAAIWLLIFFGPAFVLIEGAKAMSIEGDLATVVGLAGMLVTAPFMIWGMVEILTVRGQAGDNRFGPDPRAPGPASEPAAAA